MGNWNFAQGHVCYCYAPVFYQPPSHTMMGLFLFFSPSVPIPKAFSIPAAHHRSCFSEGPLAPGWPLVQGLQRGGDDVLLIDWVSRAKWRNLTKGGRGREGWTLCWPWSYCILPLVFLKPLRPKSFHFSSSLIHTTSEIYMLVSYRFLNHLY